jgi:hypothetical protein
MEHVGIDLGASRSAICVVSDNGIVLLERIIQTSELELLPAARKRGNLVRSRGSPFATAAGLL